MEWHDYFQSYKGYFWQWEEQGEVLAIPNSNTIAYRAFVTEVLEHLCVQGLPRFGSLLLCLIATNPGGENALNAVYALMDRKLANSNIPQGPLKHAIPFLKLLSQLPEKYRMSRNRLLLLHTLFDDCSNLLSPEVSRSFLESFKISRHDQKLLSPAAFRSDPYYDDVQAIMQLAFKFPDAKTILTRLADLPVVEEEIALEKPAPDQAGKKDFIQELIGHTHTFHVGSLIKSLWSSLQIPHHYHLPSQQPMGGIADLTNRGSLDRLLLSEFAHEELVFLSRLANNEALYVNREMPPRHNRLERVILIDVSIKSWGTPKTLAYALLLAIARHPKTDIPCSAFAVGKECHPLAFGSIDEIIASLQLLEPCLHPAEGLEAFFKMDGSLVDKEVIFIAAKEVFEQPQLRKTISDYQQAVNYLIQTDSTGDIDVYRKQQNGRKHVQHIRLDLEGQWKKEKRVVDTPVKHAPVKSAYPILFPNASIYKRVLSAEDGKFFQITAERNLMCAVDDKGAKGWEMVYENLPFAGSDVEIGKKRNGEYVLLLFNVSDKKLVVINLTTGEQASTYFYKWRKSAYKHFVFFNDCFAYSYKGQPAEQWLIFLNEEVRIVPVKQVSKMIIDRHIYRKGEVIKLPGQGWNRSILKNVKKIYINEAGNLVFNIHELKLEIQFLIICLRTPVSTRKKISAVRIHKNEFQFPDGSKVIVNRSGMLILKSSDPSIGTIYVPAVVGSGLGIATDGAITGDRYFYPKDVAEGASISLEKFWKQYITPFINTIVNHGTSDKAKF